MPITTAEGQRLSEHGPLLTPEEKREAAQQFRANYRDREKSKDFNALHLAATLAPMRPDLKAYQVALDAAQLFKLAKEKAMLAVHDCNHGLSDRQQSRSENIGVQVREIASWYGLTAETSGDPRGYVVRLHGPGIVKNGMGDGFGIA